MHSRILGVPLVLSILSSIATPQPPDSEDSDDLAGVVRSEKGAEAGVWVIAETTELPTRYAKIVVTDDGGRFLMPDLPKASYAVWVRGYGLVDSPKVRTEPGKTLDLKAVVAPNARAAAEERLSALPATSSGRTFKATSRPRRVSRARHTSPMPPAPSGPRTSYGPKRRPGPRLMEPGE